MPFVKEALLPDLLQGPPDRFYVIVLHCDIWVLKVQDHSQPLRHLGPEAYVGEDGVPALLDEGLYAELLYLLLVLYPELFLHGYLHGEAMAVPTAHPGDVVSLHVPVAADGVLNRP